MLMRTLLNMCITATYICIAVFVLRIFMKKLPAKYSYILWIIPLIRLLVPISLTSSVSIFNLISPANELYEPAQTVISQNAEYISDDVELSPSPKIDTGIPNPAAGSSSGSVGGSSGNVEIPLPAPAQDEVNSANPVQIYAAFFELIWIAGIVFIMIYSIVCVIKLRKTLKDSENLRGNIFISKNIETPFVYGIIKPKIYLPESVNAEDMTYILAHENVHIRRHDHFIKPLAFAVLTVYWFDPILWIAFTAMENDMERSCDEAAILNLQNAGSENVRKAYANALLNISVNRNRLGWTRPVCFGENNVKSRIKSVLKGKKPKLAASVTAVVILGASAACMLTNAKERLIDQYVSGVHICASSPAGGGQAMQFDIDKDEFLTLVNELSVERISGSYELPEYSFPKTDPVCFRVRFGGIFDVGDVFLDVPSPVFTDDVKTFGTFIGDEKPVCEKFIVKETGYGNDTPEFYLLDDESYDRLMKKITEIYEPFPAGHYLNSDDLRYEAYVTDTDEGKQFEILCDGNTLYKFIPDTVTAYGMRASHGNEETGIAAEYRGNGKFFLSTGFASSLIFPGVFVREDMLGSNSESWGYNTLKYSNESYPDYYVVRYIDSLYSETTIIENMIILDCGNIIGYAKYGYTDVSAVYAKYYTGGDKYDGELHEECFILNNDDFSVKDHFPCKMFTVGGSLEDHSGMLLEDDVELHNFTVVSENGSFDAETFMFPGDHTFDALVTPTSGYYVIGLLDCGLERYLAVSVKDHEDVLADENIYEAEKAEAERAAEMRDRESAEREEQRAAKSAEMIKIHDEDEQLCMDYLNAFHKYSDEFVMYESSDYISGETALAVDEALKYSAGARNALYHFEYLDFGGDCTITHNLNPMNEDVDIIVIANYTHAWTLGNTVTDQCSSYFEVSTIDGVRKITRHYEFGEHYPDLLIKSGAKIGDTLDFSELDDDLYIKYLTWKINFNLSRTLIKEPLIERPEDDWISMRLDNVTPKSADIIFNYTGEGEYFTGSYYGILKYDENSREWEPLDYVPHEYDIAWTSEARIIPNDGTEITMSENWRDIYGELPDGNYRLFKQVCSGAGSTLRIYNYYFDFEISSQT